MSENRKFSTAPLNHLTCVSTASRPSRRPGCPSVVAAPGIDNVGTRGFRPRNSGVGAAAICHDDAGYDGTRDTPHHLRDRLLLVERRRHSVQGEPSSWRLRLVPGSDAPPEAPNVMP